MKRCTACGVEKPLGEFNKKAGGLQPRCRACCKQYQAAYYERNKERFNAASKQWYLDNRDKAIKLQKQLYKDDRDAKLRYLKQYRKDNRDKIRAEYEKNATVYRERAKQWRQANPTRRRVHEVSRRARIRRVAPWADTQLMADIYLYAKTMRACGVEVHVDHIIPLKGKLVSGLHTHDNLQVVPAKVNLKKSTSFTVGET